MTGLSHADRPPGSDGALATHTFQAPDPCAAHGFEEVGRAPGYPARHAQLTMLKRLL